jgi:hypothetical protein
MSTSARLSPAYLGLALVIPALGSAAAPTPAYVQRNPAEMTLGNGLLELAFHVADGRCTAVRLVNKRAGRTRELKSDRFAIGLEGGSTHWSNAPSR